VQKTQCRRRGIRLRRAGRLLRFGLACLGIVSVAAAEPTVAPAGETQPVRRRAAVVRKPPGYSDMVRKWHASEEEEIALSPEGRPLLVLEVLRSDERLELRPLRDDGGFSSEDLERVSHALRDPRSNTECEFHPRLLDLLYRVQLHFQAKSLRVVSAYRRGRSKHGKGRAVDMVVPGVADAEVARFARTLGFIGVGVYPRSGFVHIDTRAQSYFWVDSSGPGQKGKASQILGKAAAEADARAIERGETPPSPTIDGNNDAEGTAMAEDAEGPKGRDR
jgi:uncharacterized protein YcbK (DUF882 family)